MAGNRARRLTLACACTVAALLIALTAACSTVNPSDNSTAATSAVTLQPISTGAAAPVALAPQRKAEREARRSSAPLGRTTNSVFSDPRRVVLAEAMTSCAFDWRQSLARRVAAGLPYATASYRARLKLITDVDRSNWQGSQADHAVGRCRLGRVFVIVGAPNTARMRYVRVELSQSVTSRASRVQTNAWVGSYRVRLQRDGRWLVDAELNGGG